MQAKKCFEETLVTQKVDALKKCQKNACKCIPRFLRENCILASAFSWRDHFYGK
jgi:hypothetical protein